MKTRCKKKIMWTAIYRGGHRRQCSRYAIKDGFCKIHHPDAERERSDKKAKRMPIQLIGLYKRY